MSIEENVNLEAVKDAQAQEALEFDTIKKELKPRLKCLSKNNLIDIAIRLSIEATYLKQMLESKEVEAAKPKSSKAAKPKSSKASKTSKAAKPKTTKATKALKESK